MKVILIEDIKNLGKVGDIIEMSFGNAINVYIPKNLVCEATQKNIAKYKIMLKNIQKKNENKIEELKEIINSLPDNLELKENVNEKGMLFKKIKGSDIIMELSKEFGDKIKGSIVINMEPIEKPGKYKINVEASSTKKEINILVIKQ